MATESRFDVIIDVFRANFEHGASREWTLASVYDLVGPKADTDTLVLIDRAVRIVFDGACATCITHPGWAEDQAGSVCADCLGSGRDQSVKRDDDDRVVSPRRCIDCERGSCHHLDEREAVLATDPVETLATIIAKATVALCALAAEEEGNLRTSAHEIKAQADALVALVEAW
jgi:hypothetical protein